MSADVRANPAPDPPVATHPAYRADIDGLRAVAVVAVVVYHAFPRALPGGFIGVDIFFVISGFLISTIIFGGVDRGSFSFRTFYGRRVKRIFPALALVLAACLVAGWFVLQPDKYERLAVHATAGVGFVSNLVLWRESGYFDSAAEFKPLLHLWSLGIEEQFYFVFPLLAVLVHKIRVRRVWLLGVVMVASFVWCVRLTSSDPTAAFYSPVTRFWELLVGSALSIVVSSGRLRDVRLAAALRWTSMAGGALILLALITFDGRTPFPGWRALLPVVGAALIIGSGPAGVLNRRLLSLRPMVFVGLISYPLYLWHWPLLVLARIHVGHTPLASARLGLVAAAVALAFATYRLLERPLRSLGSRRSLTPWLSLAMIAVGVCGVGIARADGVPSRYGPQLADLAAYHYEYVTDARSPQCWVESMAPADSFEPSCVDPDDGRPLTVLWGDSHAARLYPGLRNIEPRARLAQFTRSACPPVLDIEFAECRQSNAAVFAQLAQLRPTTVILFGAWTQYPNMDAEDHVREHLLDTVSQLSALGIEHIVVMGPAPTWDEALPSNMLQFAREHDLDTFPSRTTYRLQRASLDKDAAMSSWLDGQPAAYFSVIGAMCDDLGCLTTTDGLVDGLTTFDYGHLTTPGAIYVAGRLIDAIGPLDR